MRARFAFNHFRLSRRAGLSFALGSLMFILTASLSEPAQAQDASPSVHDGSHDMDFAVGRWRTEVTITKDPFNQPNEVVHLSGTKVARQFWNGKALLEEIEADGPTGHWEGATIFLYNPKSRQWSQNYADGDSGRFEGPPEVGGYRGGNLEFYSLDDVGGSNVLVRGIWKDIQPNSHTYEIARSNDGGRTWHTSFVAHLTRLK